MEAVELAEILKVNVIVPPLPYEVLVWEATALAVLSRNTATVIGTLPALLTQADTVTNKKLVDNFGVYVTDNICAPSVICGIVLSGGINDAVEVFVVVSA